MSLNIFSPIEIKGHKIKNRIVMPAMVSFNYEVKDGEVNDKIIEHYTLRAKGGVGLIIIEAICVDEKLNCRLTKVELGLWDDELIKGHKKLVSEIHNENCTVLAQLSHAGIKGITEANIAPSDFEGTIINKAFKAKEMTVPQIKEIKDKFVKAALRAKRAKYDGVEIHCAHSYLLSDFISPLSNKRNDEYGGTLDKRMKLPLEILKEIRKECGNDFIISVRMGFDEPTIDEGIKIAKMFDTCGADIIHISTGFGSSGYMSESIMPKAPNDFPLNIRIWASSQIKPYLSCKVIAVGGIRNAEDANTVIFEGYGDFAAVGRGLLCDPEFVNKIKENKKIANCFNCNKCMWSSGMEKCPGRKKYLDSLK
ncbi:NADH:flavin oxidoreductase [Anaerofustis stercorihominis]|uniref:NADH:flavin oxidoreductase n=1 Tax=Anaerofustis stercorihominis TaxID=214853 RepID=UPI00399102C3